MTNETGTNPAPERHEDGATSAEDRQHGGSTAEPRHQHGVSLQEAALQLDVSERTIRRMLREGALQGYKQKATRGQVWRVVLDSGPADEPGTAARQPGTSPAQDEQPTSTPPAAPEAGMVELVRLVEHLHRDNQQLAGQLGFLQAKVQEQERQIALLMAPKDEPETPAEPERVSWWRKLWGG